MYIKLTLISINASFPRKRESILNPPLNVHLDSRFRGNDRLIRHNPHRQSGISLIELIIFIIIVSVCLVGVLSVMNTTTRNSADTLIRKQIAAIAESLLEEVTLQPFTYCDPADANAVTASSSADCTGGTGGLNDETQLPLGQQASRTGESRYSNTLPFDNVADYNGFSMTGIKPVNDSTTSVVNLGSYNAVVTVAQAGSAANGFTGIPLDAILKIDVQVTYSVTGESITLTAYRFRYAPRSVP